MSAEEEERLFPRERERVKSNRYNFCQYRAFYIAIVIVVALVFFAPLGGGNSVSAQTKSSSNSPSFLSYTLASSVSKLGSFFRSLIFSNPSASSADESTENSSFQQPEDNQSASSADKSDKNSNSSSTDNANQNSNLAQTLDDTIALVKSLEAKYNKLQKELSNLKSSGLKVEGQPANNIIIERTVERVTSDLPRSAGGLSQTDLNSSLSALRTELDNLNTKLTNQIANLSSQTSLQNTATYQAISLTNKIDNLSNVTISNPTVTGTLTNQTLSNSGNATIGGTLTVTGATTLASLTASTISLASLSITSTTATSTFSTGGLTVGTNQFVVQQTSGNVGIGTSSPWSLLSLKGSSGAQMVIAQADTNYTQLTVDASGNLTITPSGSTITIPDDNLKICAGDACQTTSTLTGNGNLTVENNIEIGGAYNRTCAAGYVWVPGSAKFGTLPGFCVMKYEASNVGGVATSDAINVPWVSIAQPTARTSCQAVGLGYHLVSEPEWMTMAENIATTPINDMDDDSSLQLATGHSDASPGATLAATAGSDPVVSGCNLSQTMENSANAYSAGSCEIRGDGSYGGDDNDKGYYGTEEAWSATGYSSGLANKAQLRTHVLSNGSVVWDLAGNITEWTDSYVNGTADQMAGADGEWTSVTDFNNLNYARPQNPSWTTANGIGKFKNSTIQAGFQRGGNRGNGTLNGIYTLYLDEGLGSTMWYIGFRCAR